MSPGIIKTVTSIHRDIEMDIVIQTISKFAKGHKQCDSSSEDQKTQNNKLFHLV